MSDSKLPFYRRNLLPSWLPGWLGACLMIGVGFAVGFGVFLDSDKPILVALAAGLVGFGLGLAILSIVAVRQRADQTNRIAPPPVLRYPIFTAIVALYPFIAATDRSVRWPRRRGHSPELFGGTAAEVFGLIGLTIIALFVLLRILDERYKQGTTRPSMVLSLLVAVAMLVIAIAWVVRRHC